MTKKVLITGKNSYIGNSFEEYCQKNNIDFDIDKISVRGGDWKEEDFSQYDTILHVAGIAHNSSDPSLEDLYYEVNRDLTIEIANKAKEEGVGQFIFMSSIIVYGTQNEVIDENTKPNPDNFYGDSKLQAENGVKPLNSDGFRVVILRPPMIYGKGSRGNYPRLAKLAKITPIFPNYNNKRSMLYIENLCELIRLIILNEKKGTFYPQNSDYIKISELVKEIAKHHSHRIWFTRLGNQLISSLFGLRIIKKVFGDLYYKKAMSHHFDGKYQIHDLRQSIAFTERNIL